MRVGVVVRDVTFTVTFNSSSVGTVGADLPLYPAAEDVAALRDLSGTSYGAASQFALVSDRRLSQLYSSQAQGGAEAAEAIFGEFEDDRNKNGFRRFPVFRGVQANVTVFEGPSLLDENGATEPGGAVFPSEVTVTASIAFVAEPEYNIESDGDRDRDERASVLLLLPLLQRRGCHRQRSNAQTVPVAGNFTNTFGAGDGDVGFVTALRVAQLSVRRPPPTGVSNLVSSAQTITTAGGALSSVVGGSANKAIDVQTLSVFGLMSCGQKVELRMLKNKRALAPTAFNETLPGMFLGNVVLIVAVFLLDAVVARVLIFKLRRDRDKQDELQAQRDAAPEAAAAAPADDAEAPPATTKPRLTDSQIVDRARGMAKFPGVPFTVTLALYQGTAFVAFRMLHDPDSSPATFALGLVAVPLVVTLPALTVWYAAKHVHGGYYRYVFPKRVTTASGDCKGRLRKWAFPKGRWRPGTTVQSEGSLCTELRSEKHAAVAIVFAMPLIMSFCSAFEPSGAAGCVAQYAFMGVLQVAFGIAIIVRGPFRSAPENTLQGVSSICLAFAAFAFAHVQWQSWDDNERALRFAGSNATALSTPSPPDVANALARTFVALMETAAPGNGTANDPLSQPDTSATPEPDPPAVAAAAALASVVSFVRILFGVFVMVLEWKSVDVDLTTLLRPKAKKKKDKQRRASAAADGTLSAPLLVVPSQNQESTSSAAALAVGESSDDDAERGLAITQKKTIFETERAGFAETEEEKAEQAKPFEERRLLGCMRWLRLRFVFEWGQGVPADDLKRHQKEWGTLAEQGIGADYRPIVQPPASPAAPKDWRGAVTTFLHLDDDHLSDDDDASPPADAPADPAAAEPPVDKANPLAETAKPPAPEGDGDDEPRINPSLLPKPSAPARDPSVDVPPEASEEEWPGSSEEEEAKSPKGPSIAHADFAQLLADGLKEGEFDVGAVVDEGDDDGQLHDDEEKLESIRRRGRERAETLRKQDDGPRHAPPRPALPQLSGLGTKLPDRPTVRALQVPRAESPTTSSEASSDADPSAADAGSVEERPARRPNRMAALRAALQVTKGAPVRRPTASADSHPTPGPSVMAVAPASDSTTTSSSDSDDELVVRNVQKLTDAAKAATADVNARVALHEAATARAPIRRLRGAAKAVMFAQPKSGAAPEGRSDSRGVPPPILPDLPPQPSVIVESRTHTAPVKVESLGTFDDDPLFGGPIAPVATGVSLAAAPQLAAVDSLGAFLPRIAGPSPPNGLSRPAPVRPTPSRDLAADVADDPEL